MAVGRIGFSILAGSHSSSFGAIPLASHVFWLGILPLGFQVDTENWRYQVHLRGL
jgi:hypothetical protein